MLDYFNVAAGTMEGMTGIIHVAPQMAFEAGYTAPLGGGDQGQGLKARAGGRAHQPAASRRAGDR